MNISKKFILREVVGEYVIVPTGEEALKHQELITLNEVGAFLWKILQQKNVTAEDLEDAVCAEYEVSREIARQDISEFLETIRSHELLTQ